MKNLASTKVLMAVGGVLLLLFIAAGVMSAMDGGSKSAPATEETHPAMMPKAPIGDSPF